MMQHNVINVIEVFKTDVATLSDAGNIVELLRQHFPGTRINFDLHDCDKILRLEGKDFSTDKVMMLVHQKGFYCEILE